MTPKEIALKWQKKWEEAKIFQVKEDSKKTKFYCLEMFPYPSGYLHMGHVRNYSIGDAFARYKRMQGYNVLYPMGYDSFGLPAENAAIKHKTNPKEWTEKNIEGIKTQQKLLGLSYDWSREVITCKPEYYKWTQWLFLKLLEKKLVYRKKGLINWCSECKTVLANEQVEQGKCWRCKTEVELKYLEQWYIKTKEYAEKLLQSIEKLEKWPENVKTMQRNWIGKSHGTEIKFKITDEKGNLTGDEISTFTTRPDTLFGVTYLVLAAEHPLIEKLIKGTKTEKEIKEFIKKTIKKTIIERTAEGKEKNGIFLEKYFINPANGEKCQLWTADYALMEYGTGAVMAVPTHDQRDFEFAKKYNLPLKTVIQPKEKKINPSEMKKAYTEEGILINSEQFNGLENKKAIEEISKWLEEKKIGKRTINYKLKDWLISRQRYWGTPIPAVYCKKCGIVPEKEENLPILLPEDVTFKGEGNPIKTSKKFLKCKCPKCASEAERETDTMDTFIDSSWYFLRYCSPNYDKKPFDEKKVKYWFPINQYIGGIEHAVGHLIYARFFVKVLKDMKLIEFDEPIEKLLTQGMVTKDGAKMSKSIGNTVDPMKIIEEYGPDTARVFILFAALPEKELEWNDQGVAGINRFLKRTQSLIEPLKKIKKTFDNKEKAIIGKLHNKIKKTTEYLEKLEFSRAIGEIMELVTSINKYREEEVNEEIYQELIRNLIKLLSPFAPHTAEEMWEKIGQKEFVSIEEWPKYDESKIDNEANACEELISSVIADITKIKELSGLKKIKKITLYISKEWKYLFFKKIKEELQKTRETGEIMKKIMNTEIKIYGQEIKDLIPKLIKDPTKIPEHILDQEKEIKSLENAKKEIEKEFECKLVIEKAETKQKETKAKQAIPGKPGVLLE
jgi:leucyl-tRNA synthetase